jgi:hypothetical protein
MSGNFYVFEVIESLESPHVVRKVFLSCHFQQRLFDLVLFEQDSLSYNRIKFDQRHFVLRISNVFSRGVKESSPCRTQQLDGNRLSLAAGHE